MPLLTNSPCDWYEFQVENGIRWRKIKGADGNDVLDEFEQPKRESNARMVRWSDGRYDKQIKICPGHIQWP